jgi:hypothetical protein
MMRDYTRTGFNYKGKPSAVGPLEALTALGRRAILLEYVMELYGGGLGYGSDGLFHAHLTLLRDGEGVPFAERSPLR